MAWGVAYPALYLLSCLLTPWFAQPFLAWSRFPVTKQSQPPMWPQRALCNSSHPAAYGPSPQLVSDGDRREGFLSWLLASHPPVLEFREFHEVCSPWISPLSRQLRNPPAQNRRYRSCYRYLIPSSMPRVFQGTAMAWSAPIFPFSRMYICQIKTPSGGFPLHVHDQASRTHYILGSTRSPRHAKITLLSTNLPNARKKLALGSHHILEGVYRGG